MPVASILESQFTNLNVKGGGCSSLKRRGGGSEGICKDETGRGGGRGL